METYMFCNKCGSPITEGANFCRVCGQAVPNAAASSPQVPASEAPTADVSASAQAAQQIAYQPSPEAPTAGKALGSLISGILGLTMIPIVASIVAVVLGHLGLSEIKKSAGRLKGEGMAIAGLVMGYLGIAILPLILIIAAIAIPNLLRARIATNETSAVGTLRNINTAEVAYSTSHPEKGFTCSVDDLNVMRQENARIRNNSRNLNSVMVLNTKNGYNFILRDCESDISDGPVVRYKVIAAPIQFNTTGGRTFCSDESGIIRQSNGGGSDACLTDGVPLS
jgi:type IV pilus assembly protein PilA